MRKNNHKTKRSANSTALCVVAICIAIVAVVSAIWAVSKNNQSDEEIYTPNEAEIYLEKKYNMDFQFIEEVSGHYYLFSHESTPDLIAVSPTDVIIKEYGYSSQDLTDKYVDNAYYILNQQKICDFYRTFLPSNIGTYRIVPAFESVCTPSRVTLDTPVSTVCSTYKEYGAPLLWILTDTQISNETLATMQQSFQDSTLPVALRVMMVNKDKQAAMEPVDCVMQFGNNRESVLLATNINME
jgi:hypothetical protein